jgi:hypothetical protein
MISWLQTNIGSIVVVLFLLGMVALIVRRLILDKKAGKHICGGSCGSCGGGCGGCGGCPMQGQCHKS